MRVVHITRSLGGSLSAQLDTPIERHEGVDIEILKNRKEVYFKAKAKNPSRWNSKNIRNWNREEKVYLNYLQKSKDAAIKVAS